MKSIFFVLVLSTLSFSAVVDDYLNTLKQEVLKSEPDFASFDAKRGEQIFTSKHIGKKGKEISCTSCHSINLRDTGKNFFTGKEINPLSPKANPKRFTKLKNIKKWLRRNFNDVYNREGTAKEKGDVVTYIINQ
jgi:hypothetical protein